MVAPSPQEEGRANVKPDVTYRLTKDFGIPAWIALFKAAAYNRWWTERNARAALDYAYVVATAWNGDAMVGTLTVWSDGVNFAWLDDIVVRPDCRGQGIGTALVRQTVARLRADGIRLLQLFPIPGREPFFARLGFRVQPDAKVMDLVTLKGA